MAKKMKTPRVTVLAKVLPHGEGLPLPAAQSDGAAGLDLVAAVDANTPLRLAKGQRVLVPTGLSLELPHGMEAQVRPRSGLAMKHGVTVLNSPGTIDSDYRGEVQVLLVNLGEKTFTIERGERIAQLVVAAHAAVSIKPVAGLSETRRGAGGFGSTGKAARPSSAVKKKRLPRRASRRA
ncbi:MAG: dUTP diphosphatase [Hyphomonas sp.]|jgi:dUTP pyrophosphatase|nr:dUTP diphosphatase [Hyphomonas sp.]